MHEITQHFHWDWPTTPPQANPDLGIHTTDSANTGNPQTQGVDPRCLLIHHDPPMGQKAFKDCAKTGEYGEAILVYSARKPSRYCDNSPSPEPNMGSEGAQS